MIGSAARSAALYTTTYIVRGFSAFLSVFLFTRVFTPEDYGRLALAAVVASFVAGVANLGLSLGWERAFFRLTRKAAGDLIATNLAVSVPLFGAMLFAVRAFAPVVLPAMMAQSSAMPILVWSIVSAFGNTLFVSYALALFRNVERPVCYGAVAIVTQVVQLAIAIYLVRGAGWDIYAIPAAAAISTWGATIAVLALELGSSVRIRFDLLREVLPTSVPLLPRVFLGVLATQFDKLMLGLISSLGAAGIYSLGKRISDQLFGLLSAIDNAYTPELYRRLLQRERGHATPIGDYLLPFLFWSLTLSLVVVLFSEDLVRILMPPSYSGAAPVAGILGVYSALMFFGKIAGPQIIHANRTIITTILSFVLVGLNVGLNTLLIPRYGGIGAALATLLASLVYGGAAMWIGQRLAPVDWNWHTLTLLTGLFVILSASSIALFLTDLTVGERLGVRICALVTFIVVGTYRNAIRFRSS